MIQDLSRGLCRAALVLSLALAGGRAAAEDVGIDLVAGADESIQKAIASVYPTLVQIHVLTVEHMGGRARKFEAAGSGAIISADGYVVTNHHVAGKAAALRCVLPTKEELEAELVGTDALSDIAVLKLDLSQRAPDAEPLQFASFGDSTKVQVGDRVLAMGCPLALSQSVTLGIVANPDMIMSRFVGASFVLDGEDVGSLVKWIGHDAVIQPGNSGGPLVNLDGEIIGVNEIGIGAMSGAIPSQIATMVVQELIQNGHVRRPWVGASFQPLLKGSGEEEGVLVGGVLSGSPAEEAGLSAGDIVLEVNGQPVTARFAEEIPGFNMILLSQPAGETMQLKVRSGGEERVLEVATELRDDARGKEKESERWGMTVREVTTMAALTMRRADKSGVIVGSTRPGGAADKAQPSLNPGDVIVEIGGQTVEDLKAFNEITAAIGEGSTEPVPTLVVFERKDERYLTVVEVGIKKPQPPTPEVKKAWFPAATQVLSKQLAKALGMKGKKGVRITQIYPHSAVEAAGFQVGDIITHLDGNVINASEPHHSQVFANTIRSYKIGSQVEFSIVRGGEKQTIAMELDAAPKPERELEEHEDTVLEFKVRDVSYFDRIRMRWSDEEQGALITQVEQGGWAAVGGLRGEDLIQSFDGKPIADVAGLVKALEETHEKKPRRIAILVKRGINTTFIELEPRWPE